MDWTVPKGSTAIQGISEKFAATEFCHYWTFISEYFVCAWSHKDLYCVRCRKNPEIFVYQSDHHCLLQAALKLVLVRERINILR
jgi:hypothetical protein